MDLSTSSVPLTAQCRQNPFDVPKPTIHVVYFFSYVMYIVSYVTNLISDTRYFHSDGTNFIL